MLVPVLKLEPEAVLTDWMLVPEQLSAGVGVVQVAVLAQVPVAVLTVRLSGHAMLGA